MLIESRMQWPHGRVECDLFRHTGGQVACWIWPLYDGERGDDCAVVSSYVPLAHLAHDEIALSIDGEGGAVARVVATLVDAGLIAPVPLREVAGALHRAQVHTLTPRGLAEVRPHC